MAQLLNYTKGLKSCKQAKRLPLSITQMLEKLLLQNTSWKTTYAPCNLVWIPIPSLSYPKRSHYLCEIFIHHLGGYLYDCLTISNKGWQQKRKSEKDRWQITFQFKESMASPVPFRISTYNKNTIYFLIDDVITTGATMQKAAQTLRDNLHSIETPSYSDPDNNTGQIYGVTIFSRLRTQA
ncbi:MAG: hypothetical protein NZ480_04660 [Bdellovibrionaceae bacterium]|nr:hypothetical protein [Pseudobdellovibrionaceae bacterium]